MSSLTATLSPSSFQLRLAFNCRKPSTVLVRVRVGKKDCNRLHLLSIGGHTHTRNRNWLERRSVLVNSISPVDGFAGWSGTDGAETSSEAPQKQSVAGLVGAGVASIILVAGIIFAALSISKRSMSRLKQHMDPLTTQQEMSVIGDNDHNDRVESEKDALKNEVQDSDNQNSEEESFTHSTFDSKEVSFAAEKSLLINEQYGENFDDTNTTSVPAPSPSSTDQSMDHMEGVSDLGETRDSVSSFDSPTAESVTFNLSVNAESDTTLEPINTSDQYLEAKSSVSAENVDTSNMLEFPAEGDELFLEVHSANRDELSGTVLEGTGVDLSVKKQNENAHKDINGSRSSYESVNSEAIFISAGIPAPSSVPAALQALPGKVLVPAVIDQVHGQALAALQVLKVIEADVQPGDLCTRREYARWLVASSSALSRTTVSKVYPAMYIENVTELAFDDITTEDPDFPCIQGLAEAGLISSKLSRHDTQSSSDGDQSPLFFSPDSPLSRQDLVSWKIALDKRQLPLVDQKTLRQLSGFIDINKIHPDAWPALVADLASAEQGIIALAFGYTRLFQPDKPVTKAQAAIALATGEASDIVGEELARIEAESMAEKAVTAHNALIAEVEKDVNASYEKELSLEREKIDAVEKLAEEARRELERLKAEREEENLALLKEHAAVDSEMEVLSRLRREVEEQLQTLMSEKLEISYDKERLNKLRKDAELENQGIARLQYELEVERKALSMARAWAEDEAKRAREQAKALEEARERWEKHGIKVVVDNDLQEEANTGVTWLSAGKQLSVEGSISRAENLVDRLRGMADAVRGKSKDTIHKIMEKILLYISVLREWAIVLKDTATSKISNSFESVKHSSAELGSTVRERVKRFSVDCREGVEKISQKFRT
ncbi:uncharacterized protein LOC116012694 isoform X3 [Ipomoea triloba]|uniref:uncharacterized protein LOC116012694 isoform X3 n=1 Tax=Ipomoea triloba TaxID=35885 RepID=UPI00125CEBA3|nr:uncharacterized protein LOC116012694 isoform X3 [Ipomoea triloba]